MKVEPVKPGDLAIVIDASPDFAWSIGEVVRAESWSTENSSYLVISGLSRPPPFPGTEWIALPQELLKISPDAGQFEKEAERETKRPARVAARR